MGKNIERSFDFCFCLNGSLALGGTDQHIGAGVGSSTNPAIPLGDYYAE